MKSECSGAPKPDRLGLSCKANKCSDARTGDLGVLTAHETSTCFSLGDVGSTRRLRYKYKSTNTEFMQRLANDVISLEVKRGFLYRYYESSVRLTN